MGGWQTADFQGDEIRHGEHVPGDNDLDYECHGKYIGGDDDDDGLMVRMVVTYFDNHSQFHVHALVWRSFCAILTVIDQNRPGLANLNIFLADDAVKLFSVRCLPCPLEYSI